jgi:hypothetical protein
MLRWGAVAFRPNAQRKSISERAARRNEKPRQGRPGLSQMENFQGRCGSTLSAHSGRWISRS